MNYLQQILAFDDYKMYQQKLSSGQISLWHALMSIDNKTGWKSWFTAASKTLETMSGLSRSGVTKTRNVLKQLGLIDFEPHGTQAASYHINILYTSNSTQDSMQGSTQISTQISTQSSTQDSTQVETKPDKTTKPKAKKYSEDSQEFKAAKYLFSKIKNNNDNAKEPNYQSWAKDFHLIFDVDGRSKRDVMLLIDWTQKDPFWYSNILSPKKLRKHFDELILKAKAAGKVVEETGEKRWTNAQGVL